MEEPCTTALVKPSSELRNSLNDQIRKLEDHLASTPQVDLNTTNLVHGEMCARTIFIPKGTILTGALTNVDNICIMVGDITVTTDTGTRRLTGFHVLSAEAGVKRAGVAHEDTYWTTVLRTEFTDMQDIEKQMTDEYNRLQSKASPQLQGLQICLGVS